MPPDAAQRGGSYKLLYYLMGKGRRYETREEDHVRDDDLDLLTFACAKRSRWRRRPNLARDHRIAAVVYAGVQYNELRGRGGEFVPDGRGAWLLLTRGKRLHVRGGETVRLKQVNSYDQYTDS
jgi:hypothetical protein